MIIEFAGLPRSGKSSCIAVVRDYFLRSGHSVRMAGEGARSCPFSNQYRIEIACWTANQALNSILEAKLSIRPETLILQDRGLFDALAFFNLLHLEGLISEEMLTHFVNYFANPRWTRFVDLVILFDVSPNTAIERDLAAKLSASPGIITNIATIQNLSAAYDLIYEKYSGNQRSSGFSKVERLDTTHDDPLETARVAIQLIKGIIQA